MLAASVGVREAGRAVTTPENPLANARFSRFTDWPGTEGGAEISPDGRFVAFVADRDGEFDLFLSQVGTGHFPTSPRIPRAAADGPFSDDFGFSGDGGEIWYTDDGGADGAQMAHPSDGRHAARLPGAGRRGAVLVSGRYPARLLHQWGRDPVFPRRSHRRRRAAARRRQPDFFGKGMHNHNPVWSPDGQWIYFAHGAGADREMNVWRVRPSGEHAGATDACAPRRIVAPIDAARCSTSRARTDRSGPWLWSLDVERQGDATGHLRARALLIGVGQSRRPTRGRHVANPTTTLWSVPMLDRPAEDRDVAAVSAADRARAWRRDSADRRCSICPVERDRATGSGGSQDGKRVRESGRARTSR